MGCWSSSRCPPRGRLRTSRAQTQRIWGWGRRPWCRFPEKSHSPAACIPCWREDTDSVWSRCLLFKFLVAITKTGQMCQRLGSPFLRKMSNATPAKTFPPQHIITHINSCLHCTCKCRVRSASLLPSHPPWTPPDWSRWRSSTPCKQGEEGSSMPRTFGSSPSTLSPIDEAKDKRNF